MKYLILIIGFFFCLHTTIQAQGGVVWGTPTATTPQVTVDTTDGVKVRWTNRLGTDANGFSPMRFYHVWSEQFDAAANEWRIDATMAHYFVSDTTFIADIAHPLGSSPTAPVRFRIVPFRKLTPTAEPVEFQNESVVSPATLPSANRTACCIFTVIVDTRTASPPTTPTTPTLANASINPLIIPISSTTNPSISSFASLDAYLGANQAGREIAIDVKQQVDATTTKPLIYDKSTLKIAIKVGAAGSNTATIATQLKQLLPNVQTFLRTYENPGNFPVRISVQ